MASRRQTKGTAMTLKKKVLALLDSEPGLTDREITDRLKGPGTPQQSVNQACRQLYHSGQVIRREGDDGLLRNWPNTEGARPSSAVPGGTADSDDVVSTTRPAPEEQAASLLRLKAAGFRSVGNWSFDGKQILFHLEELGQSKNILYAFVVASEVRYVGKTTMALQKRLYGYQNPGPTQSTNIKNNANIRRALEKGQGVEIYALPDSGLMHYAGFHLNLAAGLEDSIVSELRPEWNE